MVQQDSSLPNEDEVHSFLLEPRVTSVTDYPSISRKIAEEVPVCLPLSIGGGDGQRISRKLEKELIKITAVLSTKNVSGVSRCHSHILGSGTIVFESVMNLPKQL